MDADELIARLAAEGELDSSGTFSLDPAVALDKLREFQLRDPTRFVLHWIRAATLLGATRVDIEVDADDVWFRFDGETLTPADVEALWSTVVAAGGSARVRACRELALGINGALHWQAKGVTIVSGAVELAVDREFALTTTTRERVEGEGEDVVANVVHAKRPLGWELIGRRRLDRKGELPEELLLASACAHARVPIWLEGKRLNPEPGPVPDLWAQIDVEDDGRWGRVSLRRGGGHSRLRVLKAGVEVTRIDLPYPHGLIDAIVDDPRLPLDLAQEKVVEGERWAELLAWVDRARWQAWFELAASGDWPPGARDLLIADLYGSEDRSWTELPGAMAFADTVALERALTSAHAGFEPLARSAGAASDRPAQMSGPPLLPFALATPGPLSLGDFIRSAKARGVAFLSPKVRDDLPFVEGLPVPVLEPCVGLRALGAVVLDRPVTVARYLSLAASTWPLIAPRQLPAAWLERARSREPFAARVAWLRGASAGPELGPGSLILVDTRGPSCVASFTLPPSWGPIWAEVHAPFDLDEDDQVHGQVLAFVLLLVLEGYHDLLADLDGEALTPFELGIVRSYLREAVGQWSARKLRGLGRFDSEVLEGVIAGWDGGWGVPDEWVEPPPSERALCDHPIIALRWLDRGDLRLSLLDVQRELALASPLTWVPRHDPSVDLPKQVWRLDSDDRAIVSEVFHGALTPFDRRAWARRGPGRGQVPETLDGAKRSVELRGEAGEIGVLGLPLGDVPVLEAGSHAGGASRSPRRGARLRLLARGHDLGWLDLPLPLGPFYGALEVPDARAAAHTDVAIKDAAWTAAAALVEAGAYALAEAEVESWLTADSIPCHATIRRIHDWIIDLDGGAWPALAAKLRVWQASLAPDHPLRVPELAPPSGDLP